MPVTIDAQFFTTGYTWTDYLNNVVKRNKSAFQAAYDRDHAVTQDAEVTRRLKAVAPHWMVIAEDWCYDSVGFLPVIVRLAEAADVELRIWPRDKNPELMDQYLTHGKRKIPIVVFFDHDFNEKGRWIERPRGAHQLVKILQADLHTKMRNEYNSGRYTTEVITEITKALHLSQP